MLHRKNQVVIFPTVEKSINRSLSKQSKKYHTNIKEGHCYDIGSRARRASQELCELHSRVLEALMKATIGMHFDV